ncbi:TapB family protein [Changchengzhania lutea]|uniref:TapB family protein n=1 Tax=Changchengzhania lutea TaxID=2049305 RepID=UPI00115C5E7E|nr:hypothetical protein [Changchengzhania lutea]
MKTKTVILICSLLISFSAISQNGCNTYYPFKEGAQFEITSFNKKGKKESVVNYEVTEINDGVATINTIISDEKGKEITTANYQVTCDGNTVSIDFKSLMNPDLFKQYKDMEIDMSGTNLEFPNHLEIRQALKDASLKMAINMGGMKMNMSIDMINRMVNAKESITTAAGTFDCFALSYNTEMKMGLKSTFKIKEWIAEGVGLVKNETYNKNDKLIGYSELTRISNN